MAAYVQELLLLDQARQQATLHSLSKYADTKNGHGAKAGRKPFASMSTWADVPMPLVGTGTLQSSSWNQEAKARGQKLPENLPVKVELTPGLVPLAGKDTGRPDMSTQKLQQATHMLQAALANWEACVQNSSTQASSEVMSGVPSAVPQQLPFGTKEDLRGPKPPSPPGLDQALTNLNVTLPSDAAELAQSLLEGVRLQSLAASKTKVTGRAEATNKSHEELKWLMMHLEHQNTASMMKLHDFVKAQERPDPFGLQQPNTAGLILVRWSGRPSLPFFSAVQRPTWCLGQKMEMRGKLGEAVSWFWAGRCCSPSILRDIPAFAIRSQDHPWLRVRPAIFCYTSQSWHCLV